MRKFNALFLLLLGAMVSFTSCSSDEEPLTAEQIEENARLELIAKAKKDFDAIVSKKWTMEAFNGTEEFVAASKDIDNATASTIGRKNALAPELGLILSFEKEGENYKMGVDLNSESDEKLNEKLLKYQFAIFNFDAGFLIADGDPVVYYSGELRRLIMAPLASDEMDTDAFVNAETGLSIASISFRDFSEMSYDDVVLSSKKLIEGNDDKVFMSEEGKLIVEVTGDYGTSHWVYKEVTK